MSLIYNCGPGLIPAQRIIDKTVDAIDAADAKLRAERMWGACEPDGLIRAGWGSIAGRMRLIVDYHPLIADDFKGPTMASRTPGAYRVYRWDKATRHADGWFDLGWHLDEPDCFKPHDGIDDRAWQLVRAALQSIIG